MKWYQMQWAQKYWGKAARERYRRYLQSDAWKTKRKLAPGAIRERRKKPSASNAFLSVSCTVLRSIAPRVCHEGKRKRSGSTLPKHSMCQPMSCSIASLPSALTGMALETSPPFTTERSKSKSVTGALFW